MPHGTFGTSPFSPLIAQALDGALTHYFGLHTWGRALKRTPRRLRDLAGWHRRRSGSRETLRDESSASSLAARARRRGAAGRPHFILAVGPGRSCS